MVSLAESLVSYSTASEIVERLETPLWGKTLQAVFEMTVTTPGWTRTLTLNVSMERPSKSFVQVTAPAKDAGILSLRLGSEMWNYMPTIERVIKIPPTMMPSQGCIPSRRGV